MKIVTGNGCSIAIIDPADVICDTQDFLDRMASARFESACVGMAVYQESLGEAFFRLRTGYAGELLQKCSNYGFKLAVVGDFSRFESRSLRDFIYECNKGKLVSFCSNLEQALTALTES